MPTSTYQVVTQQVNVPEATGIYAFTLTAPAGTKPVASGFHTRNPDPNVNGPMLDGSYPSGQNWIFEFHRGFVPGGFDLDLYLICAAI